MFSILIFLFGLCVGSFLNVVISRLKTKESIISSRSHCPQCGVILKWFDLIPVLSFLIQKARCRYCEKKISWQYPIVEIITGLLFLLIFNFQFSIFNEFSIYQFLNLIYYLVIVSFLIIIFVYDLKHYIIPDKIVYPAVLIAFIFIGVAELVSRWRETSSATPNLFSGLIAAFLAAGFFLSLVLVSKGKWMGLGDVKLAFLMGLILGWPNILLALYLAFFFGAIIGLILVIFGKKTIKSQIPFGPFLSGSTVAVLLCNNFLTTFLDKL